MNNFLVDAGAFSKGIVIAWFPWLSALALCSKFWKKTLEFFVSSCWPFLLAWLFIAPTLIFANAMTDLDNMHVLYTSPFLVLYPDIWSIYFDSFSNHKILLLYCLFLKLTSKLEWTLNDIRIEKIISVPISATKLSALLDLRHCSKLQSCIISRKHNDATLRKWQKP